jgi:hypothetical protein
MSNNPDTFHSSSAPAKPDPGPFLARVVSHQDPSFMGNLQVELLRPIGNNSSASELRTVSYLSPFYGVTGVRFVGEAPNDYNQTQKSYGMWMVPPDVGTTVMVIFIQGDPKRGYWIGCIQDENMNFMLPGVAATEAVVDGLIGARSPVAEYNKRLNNSNSDPTTYLKPQHIGQYSNLVTQGLDNDDIRGLTTSSARREAPSMVFGISTPGPVDKNPNAKQGLVGQKETQVNAFVSRLGGSAFVMDDGDAAFLRKTEASKGPPEYAAVEQNETGGDVNIPHNELVRIRTRTGHQILLHNSEDLIYIGNAKGTTWIELTSNGKIDIFAEDSISIHSENDINFTADRDINFTAGRLAGNGRPASVGNINFNSTGANNLTATGATNIRSGGNHVETAANIHMNGPAAATAPKAARIPQHEPWAGHENLDPTEHTPAKSRAVANPVAPTATYWNKYTTSIDTFKRVTPPNQGPNQ